MGLPSLSHTRVAPQPLLAQVRPTIPRYIPHIPREVSEDPHPYIYCFGTVCRANTEDDNMSPLDRDIDQDVKEATQHIEMHVLGDKPVGSEVVGQEQPLRGKMRTVMALIALWVELVHSSICCRI